MTCADKRHWLLFIYGTQYYIVNHDERQRVQSWITSFHMQNSLPICHSPSEGRLFHSKNVLELSSCRVHRSRHLVSGKFAQDLYTDG